MITSHYFLAAKSQSKQPVTKETDTEMTPLTKDIGKKDELLFEYNKFQERWMGQLLDMKNRKPWSLTIKPDLTFLMAIKTVTAVKSFRL